MKITSLLKEWKHRFTNVDKNAPSWRKFLARLAQLVFIVGRSFRQDQLRVQAASLTYTSLLALVPLFVLGLAVLRGMGYGEMFLKRLQLWLDPLPTEFQTVGQQVISTVESVDFAKLGGLGGLILIVMVVQVLGRIELSFNAVWGIKKARPILQKISQYISVTVVVPLLLVAGLTITAQMKLSHSVFESLGILKLVPFFSVWLAMTFLNLYLPYTKVHVRPALVSGFFSALLWLGWFRFYMLVQPGVARYNILYGTLASIPIFLIWLYFSWLLVLIGAKFTYAWQFAGQDILSASNLKPRQLFLCSRWVHQEVLSRFEKGQGTWKALESAIWSQEDISRAVQILHDLGWVENLGEDGVLAKKPREACLYGTLAMQIWGELDDPEADVLDQKICNQFKSLDQADAPK